MTNEWKCNKCGCPIVVGMKYALSNTGEMLCENCFKEMIKNDE